MFTAVATIRVFQQIVTELNGVDPEEDRIMVITKTVLKFLNRNVL
jgi:hypothetical protein